MNPNYTKQILTNTPTNFVDPLKDSYARQTRQTQDDIANLQTRDKQELARAKAENWTELIKEVSQFTIKGIAAAKKLKAWQEGKEWEANEKLWRDKSPDEQEALSLRYKLESNDIDDVDRKLLTQLKAKNIPSQLLYDVMSVSGSEMKKMSEFMVIDALSAANPAAFETQALAVDPSLRAEFDRHGNNPARQASMYRRWIEQKIGIYDPSDKLRASLLDEEIDKMVGTFQTGKKGAKLNRATVARQVSFTTELPASLKVEGNAYKSQQSFINEVIFRKAFYEDIPGGKTATQQATDSVVHDLRQLVFQEELSYDQIDALFEQTDALKDHPAGESIPQAFFDNEGIMETNLFKAVKEAQLNKLGNLETAAEQSLDLLEAKIHSGEMTAEERDIALFPYLNKFSKPALNKRINAIQNMPITSKGEVENLLVDLNEKMNDGSIVNYSDDEIDALYPDAVLRHQAKKFKEKYKTAQKEYGYPKNDELLVGNIVAKRAIKRTLNVDGITGAIESLPLQAQPLHGELLRKYRSMWAAEYRLNPENPNITATVNAQFKQELTENGFFVDDTHENAGIYSATADGVFENYAFKVDSDIQTTLTTTEGRYNLHLKGLHNSFKYVESAKNLPGKTLIDKALNIPPGQPGSLLSAEDVIGAYENKQFSSEIILKARLLNMDPADLLERSKDALVASKNPEHKDLIQIYDLENDIIPKPEEKIKEAIANSAHSDMLYLLNRKGIDKLTQNQYTRLLEVEGDFQRLLGVNPVDNEIKAKIEEKREANIQNNQATITADSFSATNERTDEELNQQFDAQPGIF